MKLPVFVFLDSSVLREPCVVEMFLAILREGDYEDRAVLQLFWTDEVLYDAVRRCQYSAEANDLCQRLRRTYPQAQMFGEDDALTAIPAQPLNHHVVAATLQSNALYLITEEPKNYPAPFPDERKVADADSFLVRLYRETEKRGQRIIKSAVMGYPQSFADDVARRLPRFWREVTR